MKIPLLWSSHRGLQLPTHGASAPQLYLFFFWEGVVNTFSPSKGNLTWNSNPTPTENCVAWGAAGEMGWNPNRSSICELQWSPESSPGLKSPPQGSQRIVPTGEHGPVRLKNSLKPMPSDFDSYSTLGTTLNPQEVAHPECRFQLWRELSLHLFVFLLWKDNTKTTRSTGLHPMGLGMGTKHSATT